MKKQVLLRVRKVIRTPRAKHAPQSKVVALYLLPEEIAIAAAVLDRYRKDFLRSYALRADPESYNEAEKYFDTVEDILGILKEQEKYI